MLILDKLAPYREAFWRLLYPVDCAGCGILLELDEQGICLRCRPGLEARRLRPEQALLDQRFGYLDEAWSVYTYESPVRELITALKFQKQPWLAGIFREAAVTTALMMTAEVRYDALVPIPVSRAKLVEREFNQAEQIADLLSPATGLPVASGVLKKFPTALPQIRLGREERLASPLGSFAVAKPDWPAGRTLLLIDDIVTTGATAEEAARCLKEKGAARVDLLTLARTEQIL